MKRSSLAGRRCSPPLTAVGARCTSSAKPSRSSSRSSASRSGEPITTPGLKFKTAVRPEGPPLREALPRMGRQPNQMPTKDKRFIWVDTYARWRITDPLLFFQRLRDERGAQSRLDDILDGETRNAIAKHDLIELVRTTNRDGRGGRRRGQLSEAVARSQVESAATSIRAEILANARRAPRPRHRDPRRRSSSGINYVDEVQRKVYERMIAERQRIAERFRSEGEGEAARIRGEKERELQRDQSEAYRTGAGDPRQGRRRGHRHLRRGLQPLAPTRGRSTSSSRRWRPTSPRSAPARSWCSPPTATSTGYLKSSSGSTR